MPKSSDFGPGTGPWPPGTGSPNTGTGGTKNQFFNGLRKQMEKQGWKTVSVSGFDWAALETAHYDIDTLFAAFDADPGDNLEGAHLKLSRWADSQGQRMPQTRIALAVFDSVSREQVEYITTKLQQGTRMGVQSMTAVVDLKAGRLYEPQEGSGAGNERIRVNKPVFDQLKAVVEVLAAGY
jgi:hypothetical protein